MIADQVNEKESSSNMGDKSSCFVLTSRKAGVLCAGVAVLLYLNTLDCGLVYDDEKSVSWNPDVRPNVPWMVIFSHDFWGAPLTSPRSHKSYRPLCVASFRLNYMLHGLDPMGYHLVNVILHAIVCYLYVQLCGLIFKTVWPALIAGLLFAVHPIHTEAVAGVVGRAELLSAAFFLLSFLLYHKATSDSQRLTNWPLLCVSVLLGVCGMLSKEQGITVLAVCFSYDFLILNKLSVGFLLKSSRSSLSDPSLKPIHGKSFFVRGAVVSGAALFAVLMRLSLSNGAPTNMVFTPSVNPPLDQKTPYRQLSWLYLVFVNMNLLLYPSTLSADWRYQAVPLIESVTDWHNYCTLVCISFLAGLALYCITHKTRAHCRIIMMGLILMVFPFLPASNLFFPVGFVVAERVLYLPSMGFSLLVGYGIWLLYRKTSKSGNCLITISLAYLMAVHSVKTLTRNRDWLSATTISQAGVCFNPLNPIMLSNLGIEHAQKEEYERAEILYRTSMNSRPKYSGGFYNYGLLMKLLHRYNEAEEPLLNAIQIGPSDTPEGMMPERYNLLANVIAMNSSRLSEALELTNYLLTRYPRYIKGLDTRCSILVKLNVTSRFIYECEKAVWNNPKLPSAYYNLGLAYTRLGYLSNAEVAFRNMLVLDSFDVSGMVQLATLLQTTGKTGDHSEARQLWVRVLSQQPNNTDALINLADIATQSQDYAEALDFLDNVLLTDPNHKDTLYRAGQLHFRNKHYKEASKLLTRLLHLDPYHLGANNLMKRLQRKL